MTRRQLPKHIFEQLKASFPVVFTRDYAAKNLGGLFSKSTLASFRGTYPPPVYVMSGKCVYYRDEFFDWLKSYCDVADE